MKTIKIATLDLSFQTRFGLNDETVAEYAELMRDGVTFPPVTVYEISGTLSLVDGYHRIAAIRKNGGDEVDADVTPATRVDALRAAVKANSEHGQRRSNADKRRALEVAWENRDVLFSEFLGQDADGNPNGLPSSRQLATITGVSHVFANNFINNSGVLTVYTPLAKCNAANVSDEHLEERKPDVRALLKLRKDRFGMAIPERILSAFMSVEPKRLARQVKQVRKAVEKGMAEGDMAFAGLGQAFLMKLDAIISDLKFWTPYCVCRGCRGEGCYRCSDHGFQTKSQYERNPPELKAERK